MSHPNEEKSKPENGPGHDRNKEHDSSDYGSQGSGYGYQGGYGSYSSTAGVEDSPADDQKK